MTRDSRTWWFGGILLVTLLLTAGTLVEGDDRSLTAALAAWPSTVAAALAGLSLLYAARSRHFATSDADGADGTAALTFLGLAALAWATGGVTHALTGLLAATAVPTLTFGDLFSLAALALFTLGYLRFAPLRREPRALLRLATDSYVCAASLFALLWLALFGPLYDALGQSPGIAGLALIYPVADLLVLCVLAPLVFTSPHATRRAVLLAMGAFVIISGADLLGTITRLSGEPIAGGIEQAVRVLGFALLAGLPWLIRDNAGAAPRRITGRGLYRFAPEIAAAVTLAVATVALTVAVLRMEGVAAVLPLVAGSAVLVLVTRMLGLLEEGATLARMVATRERHFHELAKNSGDVLLILDRDAHIYYVSPGTAESYGYRLDELLAQPVTSIVHPEDLPRVRAIGAVFEREHGEGVHLRVRVRAADGTWRHTEATASRYERPGEPERVLVTARDVSAQIALEEQVNHLTFHDGVTGLPNRAYVEERIREVLRRQGGAGGEGHVAVIFLDLDGFTAVNDSAGHTVGDYLLAQAARRLRGCVGPGDTVARWGGDEFAVLIEDAAGGRPVVDLANRLLRVVSGEPFVVADREVLLSASLGVAFAEPGIESGELLRNADMAMAQAKEWEGGGRVEIYAAHMHEQVVRRLELQTELRQALAGEDFFVEYQPMVELASSRVVGVEALVRWRAGDRVLAPEAFLGAAEESGLIVSLGEWVLGESCRRVARWRASEWDIGLAVNLSVRQILAPRFVETVTEALDDSGLPPSALTVEVGEDVLLEGPGDAVERLARLRDQGVRLAIDNFGMGYAALSHLRRLQVDTLKIDASFIRDLSTDTTLPLLTQAIVRLGQDLGMRVVAEGIESQQQLTRLQAMGCNLGQGFLLARPMPAADVEALVSGAGIPTG